MSSNIVSYLASLGIWNWLILAGGLLFLEVMVPGTFFLWLRKKRRKKEPAEEEPAQP